MAIYQVDVEKQALNPAGNTVYWTNVYHVVAADQASAVTLGNSIVTLEKTVHATNTTFTKMRVNNVIDDGMAGTIFPLSGVGGRTTPTDFLPMYCTVRVDFAKATGRPNRKYLRLFIGESEQTNGVVAASLVTSVTNNYAVPLLNTGVQCDEDGTLITAAQVITFVQMRQLRRGSKRRLAPVL
jgi:hypothetical protein